MDHLYAIRGWVEGDFEIVEGVRKIVETSEITHHWHFSVPAVGQHGFAFLGAVVKGDRRAAIEEQLRRIASDVDSHFSDVHQTVVGYVRVTCLSSSAEAMYWRIGGGQFSEEPARDGF